METKKITMNDFDLTADLRDPEFITEAYFTKGKEKIKAVEDAFAAVQEAYNEKKPKRIDGQFVRKFSRDESFKLLEKSLIEVFGIRDVTIYPMKMYDVKNIEPLNAWTYVDTNARFTIDALFTEEGFYDKTHTLHTVMEISTGLLDKCTPGEIVALFLHEFGHNIDPKIVDIKYEGTDYFVNSLLGKTEKAEKNKQNMKKHGIAGELLGGLILLFLVYGLPILIGLISHILNVFKSSEKRISEIEQLAKKNQLLMDKNKNTEAFADNMARMYGYGSQLASALKIIGLSYDQIIEKSVRGKEKKRQRLVADMMKSSIRDVHGTDIQRVRSLIHEYQQDLKDPNIPKKVKKELEEDMKALQELYDMYTKEKDEFKRRLNNIIISELEKEYGKLEKKNEKDANKESEKVEDKAAAK